MATTNAQRSKAIRQSLNREREYVENGQGTRNWTPDQQRQILNGEHPKDENGISYQGHHMKSVSAYREHLGNPDNIQWLSPGEHRNGAHHGHPHKPTNAYWNPDTGEDQPFSESAPIAPEAKPLTNAVRQTSSNTQETVNAEGVSQEKENSDEASDEYGMGY